MTSARASTYFTYILFLNYPINVLSTDFGMNCQHGSAFQHTCILLPSHQDIVSILTTAHLVCYMKVRRVEIND